MIVLLTLQQASEKYNIPLATLHFWARTQKIKTEYGPGQKHERILMVDEECLRERRRISSSS